ncbi:efflux transporter outer membrane subunit [Lacipirellula sp.]|uniref:efflux transporter outer membrane subunit n=1 Tax=Lacipirellula sp. TaxID=2691419 RepID=UPI003D0A3340
MLPVRHATVVALLLSLGVGCTRPREYIQNGFKVGPNYARPAAAIAPQWIDADDRRVRSEQDDLAGWWTIFNDPTLNELIQNANNQNLTLREAGFRILAARAQFGFAVGNMFPQFQAAEGGYRRFGVNDNFFDQWSSGFSLAWELDFWGRFRRAVLSAEATLDATIEDYDAVLVTLLGDVATNYVNYRTSQERIRLLSRVVRVQEDVLTFITRKLQEGAINDLDRAQASSDLRQSRAQIFELQTQQRQAQNNLCVLMGMPVEDLSRLLDRNPDTNIPVTPDYLVVGIPADLLRRRPDVRRAERTAAAQAELIGIAAADFYPALSLTGTLGWQAANLSDLFKSSSLNSSVGPVFQWNILNYGRIRNNVRFQEAQFQALVAAYQNTVLGADLEVENGIVSFLNSQGRASNLQFSVQDSTLALDVVIAQYEAGLVDFNRYAVIQKTLIQQLDLWAQSRGQIALSLVDVYRALGGGWQIRLAPVPDKQGILSPEPLPPAADAGPAAADEDVAEVEADANAEAEAAVDGAAPATDAPLPLPPTVE